MDRSHDSTGEGAPSGTQCWHQGGLLKLKLVDLWCVSLSLLEMPMLRFSLDVNVGSCEHCSWLWTSYYVDLLQGRFIELHVDSSGTVCTSSPHVSSVSRSSSKDSMSSKHPPRIVSRTDLQHVLYTFPSNSFMFPPSVNPHLFFHTFHLCPCLIFACWHWHFTTLS